MGCWIVYRNRYSTSDFSITSDTDFVFFALADRSSTLVLMWLVTQAFFSLFFRCLQRCPQVVCIMTLSVRTAFCLPAKWTCCKTSLIICPSPSLIVFFLLLNSFAASLPMRPLCSLCCTNPRKKTLLLWVHL